MFQTTICRSIFMGCLILGVVGAQAYAFDELVGDYYAYEGDVHPVNHDPPIVDNTGDPSKASSDGNVLTFTDMEQYNGVRFTTAFNPPDFTSSGQMTMEMQIKVTSGVMLFIAGDANSRIRFGINPNGVIFYGLEDGAAIVTDFSQSFRRLRVIVEGGKLSAYVDGETENFVDHLELQESAFPAADFYANHAGQVTNAQLDYIRSTDQALYPEIEGVVNAATTWQAYQ